MIFFSSDHHFFHTNVIGFCKRPYSSVEEMNEDMVEKWNTVVSNNDKVYYLGDFSLSKRAVEVFSLRLNGEKYLIPGNHDWVHPYHKKGRRRIDDMKKLYQDNGWNLLGCQEELEYNGYFFKMCHHPYQGDVPHDGSHAQGSGNFDKYFQYRYKDEGDWLLTGHVHEKWLIKNKQINVGVDRHNFTPVSINEITTMVDAYEIQDRS